jgi:hypothetical protein
MQQHQFTVRRTAACIVRSHKIGTRKCAQSMLSAYRHRPVGKIVSDSPQGARTGSSSFDAQSKFDDRGILAARRASIRRNVTLRYG